MLIPNSIQKEKAFLIDKYVVMSSYIKKVRDISDK
jgi:hypothetical protein